MGRGYLYQKPEHALTIALAGALTPTDIANLSEGVWSDSTQYDPGEHVDV